MKRLPIILAGLLVVQVALAGFALWPRSTASAAATALYPGLTAGDVVALTVYDKPDTSIKLSKQGDKWVLPEADDYPADAAKVSALVEKLVELKTNRLVTRTENSQARLKVGANDYLHRIDFQTADGASHTLYVGSSAGARATHVRAGDRPEVYLADNLNSSDATAQAGTWVDTAYLNIQAADVTGFKVKNAAGTFEFSKDSAGTWTMAGLSANEKLDSTAVTGLLSGFAPLRLTRPLGKTEKPEYGLGQPAAELSVTTKKDDQEKTYSLKVGNSKDGENTYVVKAADSAYYVRVSEFSVKDLIEKKREGFLQLPPTVTPAAANAGPATPAP